MLKFYEERNRIEVGVDEVGRGCLAGRVYAAAVVWPNHIEDFDHTIIKDSKKLSDKKKLIAKDYIEENAIDFATAWVDEKTIDRINILQASQRAMHLAIDKLNVIPEYILVDGNYFKPYMDRNDDFVSFDCIPRGDNAYISIAAASVLAKVERDQYIVDLVKENPQYEKYGWVRNKSYGTKEHMEAIKKYGVTPHHRLSFGICKRYQNKNKNNFFKII